MQGEASADNFKDHLGGVDCREDESGETQATSTVSLVGKRGGAWNNEAS